MYVLVCVFLCPPKYRLDQQSVILETRHRYQATGCRTTLHFLIFCYL